MTNEDDEIARLKAKAAEQDVVMMYCLAIFPDGSMVNATGQITPETLLEVGPMPRAKPRMNRQMSKQFISDMSRFDSGIERLMLKVGGPLMRMFLNIMASKAQHP